MLIKKSLMLSVSAALLVTAVGCGKSKSNRSPRAEAKQDITVPQEEKNSTSTGKSTQTTPGSSSTATAIPDITNDDNDSSSTDKPLTPSTSQSQNNKPSVDDKLPPLPVSKDKQQKNDEGFIVSGDESKPNTSQSKPSSPNQKTNRALLAHFTEKESVKTGGKSENLYYTSFSDDGLMEEFRSYNNKVSADQKQMNLNLAKTVVNAKIDRDANSTTVEVVMNESGQKTTYILKAVKEGDKYNLLKSSSTGKLDFQGGFLKCLDTDGACENSYTRMKFSGSFVRVIFRSSYADRSFSLQKNTNNVGFDLWKKYIMNEITGQNTTQKLDYARLSSFEVVNGRAAVGVALVAADKNVAGFKIPLQSQETGTSTNILVTQTQDLSKEFGLKILGQNSSQLTDAISEAKLVNNNGRGDLKLRMSFIGYHGASIWMILSKLPKASLTLAQIRSFEATLK
ncbi:MAG: hypothetical protein ACK41T_09040 [Pseudobdellovibrio sp.]